MAALSDAPVPELMDLAELRIELIEPVLAEEEAAWRRLLDWDFRPSADLVRRFVNMQALSGAWLAWGGRAVGYAYYVAEDRKGLIGDLYVIDEFASLDAENRLLETVYQGLAATPGVKRIECQLLMLRGSHRRALPGQRAQTHERYFMTIDLEHARRLPAGSAAARMRVMPWSEERQDDAARLIAAAYEGHVDSSINDQYRSVGGAKRFLSNIVQYPGCGSFFAPASLVGYDTASGRICGAALGSLVAADVGHVTQVSVAPWAQGQGIGYELLRQSLEALARHGCRKTSLTVTAENVNAVRLYERMGFTVGRRFAAYVWDGV